MGTLKIDLLGTSFTIQGKDSSEHLEMLLDSYKKYVADLTAAVPIKNPLQIAILSGVMLCDEIFKEKDSKAKLEVSLLNNNPTHQDSELEQRTLNMIEKIDKVL